MMSRVFLIFSCVLFFLSCKKDVENNEIFLTGMKDGGFLLYSSLFPLKTIIPLTKMYKDTLTSDSLSLDIDNDGITDFIFVLSQKFLFSYSNSPLYQKIEIVTSDDILLQYHTHINVAENYVKSSAAGDSINDKSTWVSNRSFNLITVQGNFRMAPRDDSPYISFKNIKKGTLGWFRFGIVYDINMIIKLFYIDEYCITKR